MGPSQPSVRRVGRHRGIWLRLLLILVIVVFLVEVAANPWGLHIGDRFTPLETWNGYGPVQASNGGRYVLFTHFRAGFMGTDGRPDCGSTSGCSTLHGNARLCTESGQAYSFTLTGNVHSYWSTDGARSQLELTGGSPTALPRGWVVAFHGSWHGPALVLSSPDNSFTEVFTPRGAIRHVTSTADAGGATATLRYGSGAGFDRACHLLAAG
jgi:hypothetical protein